VKSDYKNGDLMKNHDSRWRSLLAQRLLLPRSQ
jgi:hypothetical protein